MQQLKITGLCGLRADRQHERSFNRPEVGAATSRHYDGQRARVICDVQLAQRGGEML